MLTWGAKTIANCPRNTWANQGGIVGIISLIGDLPTSLEFMRRRVVIPPLSLVVHYTMQNQLSRDISTTFMEPQLSVIYFIINYSGYILVYNIRCWHEQLAAYGGQVLMPSGVG